MKMVRIGRTDSDQKDMLSQMRTELSHNLELTAPDSHSKMDLVHLREDLDRLRRDLGSHGAQIKQQAAVEARNAAQEVLTLHWQNQEAKLVVNLKASEPTGKERCRSRDAQPEAKPKAAAVTGTETQQNRTASLSSQGSASSCFSRGGTRECVDSWLYLPASTWIQRDAESFPV